MNKKLSTLFALILLAGFVSGCSNTWNGAGKDLKGFGNWLEETF